MTEALKPCPFCGSERVRLTEKRKGNYRREGSYFQGLCGSCFARGPLLQSREAAVEEWNARSADSNSVDAKRYGIARVHAYRFGVCNPTPEEFDAWVDEALKGNA